MEIIRQKEQCFDRYIVSGHWPVSLYDGKIQRHDPIIDDQTHIISIDGGCGLKEDGQLNLLIFPELDCNPCDIGFITYDGFPTVTALEEQVESTDPFNLRYTDDPILKITALEDEWVEVEHSKTGHRIPTARKYLCHCPNDLSIGDTAKADSLYRLPFKRTSQRQTFSPGQNSERPACQERRHCWLVSRKIQEIAQKPSSADGF